jgi:hypothetical protein
MADDSVTGGWPGVSRVGQPELIRGQLPGSLKRPNEHKIHTTPVPAGAVGQDWLGYFNSKLSQSSVSGYHDRMEITVEYYPDDESKVIETVYATIEYANERLTAG